MAVMKMPSKHIEDYPEHYWKSYKAMKDNFHECPSLFDIGNEAFQRKVVDVLPKEDSLKILGIGSGRGELDCINMRRILTHFSRINNTVVEPSAEAIDAYRSLISRDLSDRVTTSWCQETFEQFRKRRESSGAIDKFHFISAVHSLYYADKDGSCVEYLIDLLEEDGVLFIVIQNDNSGFSHLFKKIADYFGTRHMDLSEGRVTSQVVKRLDADERVVYEVIKRRHQINITSCFESDSLEGSLVLDFLTQIVEFKSTISENILQSVMEYLKTPDCSEILSDGKIIFREDWDALVIRKK